MLRGPRTGGSGSGSGTGSIVTAYGGKYAPRPEHSGQIGPPQSTPCSSPFCAPSLQVGQTVGHCSKPPLAYSYSGDSP